MRSRHRLRAVALRAAVVAGAVGGSVPLYAIEVDAGNPDFKIRWDNTFKYSAAWRVAKPDGALLADPNQDDGDRNFSRGLISNRVDVLSEFDLVYAKRHGFRITGAAWYDSVYNSSNDNPGFGGGAFPNRLSGPADTFSPTTRRLHGRDIEVLDAFAFTGLDVGSTRLNVRAGQHALVWGESVFFGSNAIAGGMGPVDVIKLLSVPNTQFKEAIRPVPQLSAQWQLSPAVSVGAFYQFRWAANRLPSVGSYFSGVDTAPEGGEQLLLAGPTSPFAANARRLADERAKNSGQGGLQLRVNAGETDLGLYLIRFHEKSQQVVAKLGLVPSTTGGMVPGPIGYADVYAEGITAFGASASRTFGDLTLGTEASIRHNMDLASGGLAVDTSALTGGTPNDNRGNPAYAVGNTAHVNVNALWTVPRTPLFNEASLLAEVAWNRVLKVTKGESAYDPHASRDAVAMRMQFEPLYRQVIPGLDVGVPIGLSYSPRGSRSGALGPALGVENGGDITIGLNGSYLDAWRFSLAYTHYYGTAAPLVLPSQSFSYQQFTRDRDFVALSVRRSF